MPSRQSGFTVVELVATMVIVVALAVLVVPRLTTSGFDRYAFRHELLAALQYAQKTAMGSGCEIAVQLDAGTDSYSVRARSGGTAENCGGGGFTEFLNEPADGGDYTGTGGSGADLQTSGRVVFDGFGGHAGGPTSISLAGGASIEIDDVTGYVRD